MKHTPTPWETDGEATVLNAAGVVVANCGDPDSETNSPEECANAATIVRAVNAYGDLVDALRAAHVALSFCGKAAQARGLAANALRKVEAALAKAEEA